jgi:hypothetical protein
MAMAEVHITSYFSLETDLAEEMLLEGVPIRVGVFG